MIFGPVDSAIRVLGFWSVSTAIIVWFSADFATRKPRDIPVSLGLLVALASIFNRLAALLAPFPVFLDMYPDRRAPLAATMAFAAAGFGLIWANSILIQLLQNVGYRRVGAKERPIRWYRGFKRKRRRAEKKRQPMLDAAEEG
jgi:hypothetical protein